MNEEKYEEIPLPWLLRYLRFGGKLFNFYHIKLLG